MGVMPAVGPGALTQKTQGGHAQGEIFFALLHVFFAQNSIFGRFGGILRWAENWSPGPRHCFGGGCPPGLEVGSPQDTPTCFLPGREETWTGKLLWEKCWKTISIFPAIFRISPGFFQ